MSIASRQRNELLHHTLAKVAPGTALREGLDRIVRAKMGALLVLADTPSVLHICSGGFLLDSAYSPQRLSELAKMDGAIILSSDGTRIARANVHLVPDRQGLDRHLSGRRGDAGALGEAGDHRVQRHEVQVLDAQILRGKGDQDALKIINEATGKDPEFYAFYRTLQAYRETLRAGDTTMVLSPDSDFFRYFEHPDGAGPRKR